MNRKLIFGPGLALLASAATAQNATTLYGVVDLGVTLRQHAPIGSAATTLDNGGVSPSIWGIRGQEELGASLKALFNLEGQFKADDGTQIGPLLRRQANVGISAGALGILTLGVQYGPAVLAFATTDPRGIRENYSGLYPWAYGSGNNANQDVGVFLKNAVSYNNNIEALHIGAAYSASEGAGSVLSLGASYAGPVTLSAAYQSANQAGTSERVSTKHSFGASYGVGAWSGKLNYLQSVNKDGLTFRETTRVGMFGLGLEWKMASNNTVMAAVYSARDSNHSADKTTTLILSDEYAISRRTTCYATLASADAGTAATANTSVVAGGTLANARSQLLNVGIKHSF